MNAVKVIVKLMDGTLIRAKTNIGNARRISDFINKTESLFIVLFDVSMEGQQGGVIFVNRDKIMWVTPDEDRAGKEEKDSLLALKIEGGSTGE